MAKDNWKARRDPLYRGDAREGVQLPRPEAEVALVEHILYLGGFGRQTRYLSVSESRPTAEQFAGRNGQVYRTMVPDWEPRDVSHRARKELVQLLRGTGKGDAQWPSAFEVQKARQYVEEHAEHLADFKALTELDESELRTIVDSLFEKS